MVIKLTRLILEDIKVEWIDHHWSVAQIGG